MVIYNPTPPDIKIKKAPAELFNMVSFIIPYIYEYLV